MPTLSEALKLKNGGVLGFELPSPSEISSALSPAFENPSPFSLFGLIKAAESGFRLPGDVFAGRVDPLSEESIRRSGDLAGMLAAGGTGAALARPGTSLGMFGGKLPGKNPGKPKGSKASPERRIEHQGQSETIESVDLPGARKLKISFQEVFNTNTQRAKDGSFEVDFKINQPLPASSQFKNVKIRSPEHRKKLGIAPPSAEETRIIRRALVDSVTDFVSTKKPQRITFSPADSRLQAFYDKAAPLLAKKLGGKHSKEGVDHIISFFDKHGKPLAGASVLFSLGEEGLGLDREQDQREQILSGELI